MRTISSVLMLVLLFVCGSLTMAQANTDDVRTSVSVVGGSTKVTPKDNVTINLPGGVFAKGRIALVTKEVGDDYQGYDYVVAKGTTVQFSQAADRVTITRLEPHSSLLGVTAFKRGDDRYTEVIEDVDRITLGPGEVAWISWKMPPPAVPVVVATPIEIEEKWFPPNSLRSGVVITVSGLGGYMADDGFPAFPGSSVVVSTPMTTLLRGFAASWMFVKDENGRDTANTPDDAGPTMSYSWGQWSPWEDKSSYKPEIGVWVAPFWQQFQQGTNTLAFRTACGPQFRLRSAPKPGVNRLKSFGAYWTDNGWQWTKI